MLGRNREMSGRAGEQQGETLNYGRNLHSDWVQARGHRLTIKLRLGSIVLLVRAGTWESKNIGTQNGGPGTWG
jgi:hypothetical protein